jgi:hypothetical protein
VATYRVDLAKTGADPDKPAKGVKVAAVSLALSAIAAAHRAAGHTLDTRVREIRVAMKGIRKTYTAPRTSRGAQTRLGAGRHCNAGRQPSRTS